jgi:hypothetical protein
MVLDAMQLLLWEIVVHRSLRKLGGLSTWDKKRHRT